MIETGQKVLTEAFRSRIYVKRLGGKSEQLCRELKNGYVARSREQPFDLVEVNRQMEYYKPPVFQRRNEGTGKNCHQGSSEDSKIKEDGKVEDEEGEQYYSGDKTFPCFKCGRCKPDCNRVKNCKHKIQR